MKFLLSLFLSLFVFQVAQATNVDISNLSAKEQQRILDETNVSGKTSEALQTSATAREELSKWGQLGANVGQAMVQAAKQIGVAAADFANTPLGKVVVAVIVYKIIGASILQSAVFLLAGSIFMVAGLWSWATIAVKEGVEYEYVPKLWGLYQSKRVKSFAKHNGDLVAGKAIFGGFLLVVSLFFLANVV